MRPTHALIGQASLSLGVWRHGGRHFHFVLEYRDLNVITKTRENLGYFIKQIENSFCICTVIETWIAPFQPALLDNGYPERTLDRAFIQGEKDKPTGPAKCPVYLKHPWIGQTSKTFRQSIKFITEQTFFVARLVGIFSTKTILPLTHKESLPASLSSCVVDEFKCECGSRYVGRTNQRLGDRSH